MDIAGGVAVVTGGASGLGLATARVLSAAGAHVALLDLPTSPGAERAAEFGGSFTPADVTDDAAVATALDSVADRGPLRVIVNCAGVATPGRVISRTGVLPLESFTRVVTVNLVGTFNVLRLGAERIQAQEPIDGERGVIVNTASAAAFDGQIGQAAYAASKGGIVAMTLPIARDLADRMIRVMTIAPGLFETPLLAGLPQDARDSLARQVPHPNRLGRPEEFAALVAHIVANPMLNGETIRLDGAIRMAPR